MKLIKLTLVGLLACSLASCAQDSTDTAPVTQLRDDFIAAFNAGDAAKVAELYAADAVTMPSHQPAQNGRPAIETYNKTFFQTYTAKITITPVETKRFGDWALDRGTYTMQLTPKSGDSAMTDDGKYLVILQKQADGAWKVTHDIDNTSVPAPPPPVAEKAPAEKAPLTAKAPVKKAPAAKAPPAKK